ncbi:MAG: hypothetical protein WAJ93_02820, partial [Candidatus Nitrosopolaris sp.]
GLSSKSKRNLVPFDTKDREGALAARIKQLGYNIINIKYKAAFGYYNSSSEDNNNNYVDVTTEGSLLTTHTEFFFFGSCSCTYIRPFFQSTLLRRY